jgi:hypothetical protein
MGIFAITSNKLSQSFLLAKYNNGKECFCWWLGICDKPACKLHHSEAPMVGTDDPLFGKVVAILNNYKPPNMEGGAGR